MNYSIMSLFTINRYTGDLPMRPDANKTAQTIIDTLNAKAKEREVQRRSSGNQKSHDPSSGKHELPYSSPRGTLSRGDSKFKSKRKKTTLKVRKPSITGCGTTSQDETKQKNSSSSSPAVAKKVRKTEEPIATSDVDGRTSKTLRETLPRETQTRRKSAAGESPLTNADEKSIKKAAAPVKSGKSPTKKSSKRTNNRGANGSESGEVNPAPKHELQADHKGVSTQPENTSNIIGEEGSEKRVGNKRKRKKERRESVSNEKTAGPADSAISYGKKAKSKEGPKKAGMVQASFSRGSALQQSVQEMDAQSIDVVGHKPDVEISEMDVACDEETEDAEDNDEGDSGEDEDREGDEEEEDASFQVLGDIEKRSKKKVRETLPDWLAHPSVIEQNLSDSSVSVESVEGLDVRLVKTLTSMGIVKLFPVQHHVIPAVLASLRCGLHAGEVGYRPRDLCVSAPTGSGKTLAYSVPIVQALIDRVVPQVRALIVLPTRDLATQVHKVVTSLCRNTPLRAVLVGGTRKFAQEQSLLVKEENGEYQSLADIVVATPGRLVDNINHTPGFTLHHLRFLVIDEADRMMDQISQDWIAQVEKSAYGPVTPLPPSGLVPHSKVSVRSRPGPLTVARSSCYQLPLQKLLFSATLSQNPEKLTQLRLFRPRLVTTATGGSRDRPSLPDRGWKQPVAAGDGDDEGMAAGDEEEEGDGRSKFVGKYSTPVGLSEYFVQCTAGEKPLALMHLLTRLHFRQVLCFTNTVQATHRLFLLLKLMGGVDAAEFSSNLQQSQRQAILKQFKSGKIQILVCSDAMARGMDIENVRCVISYDLPPHLKTYVHRVGRTARAGRAGSAFSFIRKKEVTKFKQMLRNAGKDRVQRHAVSASQLESLIPPYTEALSQLPAVLKEEKAHQY